MKLSRRQTLASIASSLALAACKPGLPSESEPDTDDTGDGPSTEVELTPGTWSPAGTEDLSAFPYGLQSGDATDSGVVLSVRTGESTVTMLVVEVTDEGWREAFSSTETTDDGVAQVDVDGLKADARYSWVVFGSDGQSRTFQGWFRTAPQSGTRTVRFGATSCLGGNRPVAAADPGRRGQPGPVPVSGGHDLCGLGGRRVGREQVDRGPRAVGHAGPDLIDVGPGHLG